MFKFGIIRLFTCLLYGIYCDTDYSLDDFAFIRCWISFYIFFLRSIFASRLTPFFWHSCFCFHFDSSVRNDFVHWKPKKNVILNSTWLFFSIFTTKKYWLFNLYYHSPNENWNSSCSLCEFQMINVVSYLPKGTTSFHYKYIFSSVLKHPNS